MSGLPVPCPTCDGNARVPAAPWSRSWVRECPLCKGSGLVTWVEKKVGRAMGLSSETLDMFVGGPLALVRHTRARLKSEVAASIQRLGGDPRRIKRERFTMRRLVGTDWRTVAYPLELASPETTDVVAKYQVKALIPEPYTGLVHRED